MNLKNYIKSLTYIAIPLLLLAGCGESEKKILDLDKQLSKAISLFKLSPLTPKPLETTAKYKLGRALFFDPILSGNRDVACATCHLTSHGTSDGRALSIGVGGVGLGPDRLNKNAKEIHPRNSQGLWNRDHYDFSSMFWDGRVEMIDKNLGLYRSPLEENLPAGLDNVMAAQAIFPLLTPNEMLGYNSDKSSNKLQAPHQYQPNEFVKNIENPLSDHEVIFFRIMERLIGPTNLPPSEKWQTEYRGLLQNAYPGTELRDFNIVHIANAIAHFEELAFSTRFSSWDAYLKGNHSALTDNQKRGALIFYGKGRCVACHSGQLQSDLSFHSIGVIDTDARIASETRDKGRYDATNNPLDKYKFRTPPLRNVLNTAPYFHNGSAKNIREAISQHINPLKNATKYHKSGRFLMNAEQADSVSPILQIGLSINKKEQDLLIEFLQSLSYQIPSGELNKIVPKAVPSQLPVHF